LILKIQEQFQSDPDWYRRGGVRALVGQYYVQLRSVLRTHPRLRPCLCRCRQCRIFFLTHPRNAGRQDLRCPFGCRVTHRRRNSTQRSVAYYRTQEGKEKKKLQNGKRGRGADPHRRRIVRRPPAGQEGMPLAAEVVRYVGMVTSLIEGRRVSEEEIREMLARAVRQHRMARRRRIDYILHYLRNNSS
jgi:hypothetical protein